MNEGILGSPLTGFSGSLLALERALSKKDASPEEITKITQSLTNARKKFLEKENRTSDQNIMAATCRMFYTDVDASQHPKGFYEKLKSDYGDLNDDNSFKKMATTIFAGTAIFNDEKWNALMAKP